METNKGWNPIDRIKQNPTEEEKDRLEQIQQEVKLNDGYNLDAVKPIYEQAKAELEAGRRSAGMRDLVNYHEARAISLDIANGYNSGDYSAPLVALTINIVQTSYDEQRNLYSVCREKTKDREHLEREAIILVAPNLYRVMFQEIPKGQRPEDNILLNF